MRCEGSCAAVADVVTALRVADEYVWIYGEKFRWWPTPNGRVREKTWPEAPPGCEKALRFARDRLSQTVLL